MAVLSVDDTSTVFPIPYLPFSQSALPQGHFDLDYKMHPKETCSAMGFKPRQASCQLLFVVVVPGPFSACLIDNPTAQRIKKVTSSNQSQWFGWATVTEALEDRADMTLEFVRAESWRLGELRNGRKAAVQWLKEETAKTLDGSRRLEKQMVSGQEGSFLMNPVFYDEKFFRDEKKKIL